MRTSFLPYLVDPDTREELELVDDHVAHGRLVSGRLRSSTNEYPIVRGIPRFAGFREDGRYARSFGFEWNRWPRVQFDSENVGGPMEGYTGSMWQRICAVTDAELQGATVVELGCGSGRFLEVARKKRARAIGLDMSSAVEAAAANFDDDADVLICQADALKPPIRPASVDGAYSIGVLHHTPAPATGAHALSAMVRPGGWVALCVYGKGSFYDFPTVAAYRKLFTALSPVLGHYPSLAYTYATAVGMRPLAKIPILGKALRVLLPFSRLPDVRWSVLETFDAITPSHQSTHESYEVFQWLRAAGLEGIEPSNWGFTSYHARKPRVAGDILAAPRVN